MLSWHALMSDKAYKLFSETTSIDALPSSYPSQLLRVAPLRKHKIFSIEPIFILDSTRSNPPRSGPAGKVVRVACTRPCILKSKDHSSHSITPLRSEGGSTVGGTNPPRFCPQGIRDRIKAPIIPSFRECGAGRVHALSLAPYVCIYI